MVCKEIIHFTDGYRILVALGEGLPEAQKVV